MKKKVIVAGHICLHITPVFPDKRVKKISEILSPGKQTAGQAGKGLREAMCQNEYCREPGQGTQALQLS